MWSVYILTWCCWLVSISASNLQLSNICITRLYVFGVQRLINLEIPVLIGSRKPSNIELGQYLDERLFKCWLSTSASPKSWLDLISRPLPVVASVLMQLNSVGWHQTCRRCQTWLEIQIGPPMWPPVVQQHETRKWLYLDWLWWPLYMFNLSSWHLMVHWFQ